MQKCFSLPLNNKLQHLGNSIIYSFLLTIFIGTLYQCAYAQNESNVDYSSYLKNIQKQIKTNWHPPQSKLSNNAQVLFSIDKNGNVPNVRISHSSDNTEMDSAALKAVVNSQPFPVPPGNKDISVQFTFDYNVHCGPINKQTASTQGIIGSLFSDTKKHHNSKTANNSFVWVFGVLYVLLLIYRNFAKWRSTNKDKEETFVGLQNPVDKDKSKDGILD